jgi:1-acyl-sn-glycerol-3-phosphate acyltransferase
LNARRAIESADSAMPRNSTGIAVRALRLARFSLHLVRAVLIVGLIYPFLERPARRRRLKQWSAQLLRIFAIHLRVTGTPPDGGAVLIVANHVSWLDIVALNAACPVRFVAKSEIRRWPLIGWLCARGDTLFIHRARRYHTREITREMVAAMRGGDAFAVFPEGTTTHGDVLLPFHASLLQPALACDARVYPVALRYSRADRSLCIEADYEGDKTLIESLLQLITQPQVHLSLQFLPPIACAGIDRRELADEAAQRIATRLGLAAPCRRAGTTHGPTI